MHTWRERNQRMKLIRYGLMAFLVFALWQYSKASSTETTNESGIMSIQQLKQKEPYFLRASDLHEGDDVAILTQLTVDRIDNLVAMSKAWNGPISATILIRNNEDLDVLIKSHQIETLRKHVDFHVWLQSNQGQYPVNHLRNFAVKNTKCNYILTLDVDFVPSVDSYEILREFRERLDQNPRTALVIPAFELGDAVVEVPKTADEVRLMMDSGKTRQVHFFKGRRAHAPTDYPLWRALSKPTADVTVVPESTKHYATNYEYLWEPYVMVKRDEAPDYDERFVGYGNDKVSFTYELAAKGFKFEVLRDTFIMHRDHGVPSWRVDQGSSRAWRRWADFVRDVRRKYDGFEVEVPEWLKQDCLRGDCPAFWNWFR